MGPIRDTISAGVISTSNLSAKDQIKSRLEETITQIYSRCASKTHSSPQVERAQQVKQWNVSYQTGTPKIVKWIAGWLAKIGCNTRYSLHEEFIQLERIAKAIPVLEKEQTPNSLATKTLEVLKEERGVEKLTLPQKILVATAAKDWSFLCLLGEEAACFDGGSIKNTLFPPGYTESQLREVWQNAIYECIVDKQSDPNTFRKLVKIGMKSWLLRIQPLDNFNVDIVKKIRNEGPLLAWSRDQELSPIQIAVLHNRPDFVQCLHNLINEMPCFTYYRPDTLLNEISDKNLMERVEFFDTIRILNPETATAIFDAVCASKGKEGFLLQKALLQQKRLSTEERSRLEQLVSLWIPQKEISDLLSKPDFTFTYQGKNYPCSKAQLQQSSTWFAALAEAPDIGGKMELPKDSVAGPHLERLLKHVQGVEQIAQDDTMYAYFGLTTVTFDYVQNFAQLIDRHTNLPMQQGTDWNLSCSDEIIPVHTLVFTKSLVDFRENRDKITEILKNTPIETTKLLIQFLYTRTPPEKRDRPALLDLCKQIGVQPALCSLLE